MKKTINLEKCCQKQRLRRFTNALLRQDSTLLREPVLRQKYLFNYFSCIVISEEIVNTNSLEHLRKRITKFISWYIVMLPYLTRIRSWIILALRFQRTIRSAIIHKLSHKTILEFKKNFVMFIQGVLQWLCNILGYYSELKNKTTYSNKHYARNAMFSTILFFHKISYISWMNWQNTLRFCITLNNIKSNKKF